MKTQPTNTHGVPRLISERRWGVIRLLARLSGFLIGIALLAQFILELPLWVAGILVLVLLIFTTFISARMHEERLNDAFWKRWPPK